MRQVTEDAVAIEQLRAALQIEPQALLSIVFSHGTAPAPLLRAESEARGRLPIAIMHSSGEGPLVSMRLPTLIRLLSR